MCVCVCVCVCVCLCVCVACVVARKQSVTSCISRRTRARHNHTRTRVMRAAIRKASFSIDPSPSRCIPHAIPQPPNHTQPIHTHRPRNQSQSARHLRDSLDPAPASRDACAFEQAHSLPRGTIQSSAPTTFSGLFAQPTRVSKQAWPPQGE